MSVKIEILDYKYGEVEGNQMISNSSFTSSADWYTGSGWSIAGGAATHSGANGYLENNNVTFIQGQNYRIKYKISGRTAGSLILANHLPNNANGFIQNGNGDFSYDWIQGSSNNNKLSLAGWSGFDGSVEYAKVYLITNIDWEKSVVGELDVTDHSDFPLAMTFQISDIKDLTSTSGDYSKTFKIPATKNNNKLLKHTYTANIDTDVNLTENKKCIILVNNLFSIKGLIKVTGIGGYGETPSYYNCVFFGSNLSWADDLSNKYMNELDWGSAGKDLEYNKTSIMATWQDDDCDSSTSPIVYPIVSYGDYNPDGQPKTIQLLDTAYDYNQTGSTDKKGYYGFFNDGSSYETPNPSADWRPAVFVKDTLEKIFSQVGEVGYTINSTFMETDMFKKLVWLLPNFKYNNAEEQYDEFSLESNFTNGVSMSATGSGFTVITEDGIQKFSEGALEQDDSNYFWSGAGRELLEIDAATNLNITLDEGSYVDSTTHYITIGEYGYYDINLNGIQSKIARAYKGGGDDVEIDQIDTRINLEVQTVGQTSWIIINSSEYDHVINQDVDFNTDASTSYENMPSINMKGMWLNKGDKIRLTLGTRLWCYQRNWQEFLVWIFFKSGSSSTFDITLNSEEVDYGQTYDLDKVINKDYKQIDFVKGIAHAFNLKMTTDETTRTVNIEPFNTFYKDYADAIDWTYKLDRSRQIEDKWIQSDLKRDVVFQYKPDSKDKKVEARGEVWWNGIKDEYPYQETLPKTFEKGESKYENPFFAGTHNAKDQDTTGGIIDTAYSAVLWEGTPSSNDTSRPPKGYEFLPRLLYWNKYSPPTVAAGYDIKLAKVQTWANTSGFILANAAATSLTSNIYPQATSINRDDSSSPILSYGNVGVRDYDDATGVYSSSVAGKGLFETYYKNMFEMFKAKPRLRTVYIDLKTTDIINLDFRKLVYIDGVYWRINKVVDYQPNKNQPTKVELVEWLQLGAFAATAPSFGGNNNTGGLGWQDGGVEQDNDDIGL
jgi:hypothetical protein